MEFRLEPERAERIRYAASLERCSVSSFVVDAADERARRIIRDQQMTVVPSEYFDRLLAALDAPSEPNWVLANAAKRLRDEVTPRR
jgi:uncharacterized protein (DUF1778 family)